MIHCYLHSCFQSIFSRLCRSANDQKYTLTSEEGQGLDWFCFWTIADDSGRVMEGRCCHYVVDGCCSNVINASWKDFPHVAIIIPILMQYKPVCLFVCYTCIKCVTLILTDFASHFLGTDISYPRSFYPFGQIISSPQQKQNWFWNLLNDFAVTWLHPAAELLVIF